MRGNGMGSDRPSDLPGLEPGRGLRSLSVAAALLGGVWAALALPGALPASVAGDVPRPTAADRVDATRVLSDVGRLSGAEPMCVHGECRTLRNRLTGSTDLAWALRYLSVEMEALGYAIEAPRWVRGTWADHNLIVRRAGTERPDEDVYVVAHVDGVASCADGRCPGADDNASGTAAVMELARLLQGMDVERTVVLFISTGEEQGMLGVRSYVDGLPASDLQRITSLINLDMIGYDGNGDRVMELYHEDHPPSLALAEVMSQTIAAADLGLVPRLNPGCG